MTHTNSNAKLILFCGPSGSGKTSIVQHLLKRFPQLSFSISATTRLKRNNEEHGKDYYFISVDEFHDKIKNDEFLEWEQVYINGFYGTLRSEVDRIAALGKVAIFDVDVEGGIHIKGRFGENLLDVFVRPPTIDDLHRRLISRASETPETLEKRIQKAAHEITYSDRFTYLIINKDLEVAFEEASGMVEKFLAGKH
jgi:guanylate kinase